jgi:hypothetical protein
MPADYHNYFRLSVRKTVPMGTGGETLFQKQGSGVSGRDRVEERLSASCETDNGQGAPSVLRCLLTHREGLWVFMCLSLAFMGRTGAWRGKPICGGLPGLMPSDVCIYASGQ